MSTPTTFDSGTATDPLVHRPLTQDPLGPQLVRMLDHITPYLHPRPGRVYVAHGEVAWDSCCDGGQAWVRIESIEPMTGAKLGGQPCQRRWVATLGVGVLRCVASMDEQGNPPPPERITLEAVQQAQDEASLCAALACLDPSESLMSFVRWDPLGPDGGCAGGEWIVTLTINTFGCP